MRSEEGRDQAPSKRRLERARREGVTPHSPLLSSALLCACALVGLRGAAAALHALVSDAVLRAPERGESEVSDGLTTFLAGAEPIAVRLFVGVAALAVVAWAVGALQVGPRFDVRARPGRRLVPDPKPTHLAAVVFLALFATSALIWRDDLTRLGPATRAWGPGPALQALWLGAVVITVVALVAGVVDSLRRRAAWRSAVAMTRREKRDEQRR